MSSYETLGNLVDTMVYPRVVCFSADDLKKFEGLLRNLEITRWLYFKFRLLSEQEEQKK